MIRVHRLNGSETVVNAELIETIEICGKETVLAMATGNKIIVRESAAEIIDQCVAYKKTVFSGATYLPEFLRGEQERSSPCH